MAPRSKDDADTLPYSDEWAREREAVRQGMIAAARWAVAKGSPEAEAERLRGLELLERAGGSSAIARHMVGLFGNDGEFARAIFETTLLHCEPREWPEQLARDVSSSDYAAGESIRRSAAAEALELARKDGDTAANVPGALEALETALERPAAAVLGAVAGVDAAAVEAVEGQPFRLDEAFIGVLEAMGPEGKRKAAEARASSCERAAKAARGELEPTGLLFAWLTYPKAIAPRYLVVIAWALWRDEVRRRFEEKARKPVALVHQVHETVSSLFSRGHVVDCSGPQLALPLRHGGASTFRLRDEATLALVDAAALAAARREAVRRGIVLFGSVAGHRVIRHQISTGHEQAISGNPDPRVIVIEGGWAAYAEALGMGGKKAAEQVRDIVEAEHACEIPLPDGSYGTLLSRETRPAFRGQPALVTLILGTALLPHYVNDLRRSMGAGAKSRGGALALRLVPVLPLPPFVGGRSNEHGPQATLSMDLMSFLRERARELVEEGGVHIDAEAFARMAVGAGVPRSMAAAVLDRWTRDGDDGPALLKRVGHDRYTLGDAYAAARAFLEDAGRSSLKRSEAAREDVRRRRERLETSGRRRLKAGGSLCRAAGTRRPRPRRSRRAVSRGPPRARPRRRRCAPRSPKPRGACRPSLSGPRATRRRATRPRPSSSGGPETTSRSCAGRSRVCSSSPRPGPSPPAPRRSGRAARRRPARGARPARRHGTRTLRGGRDEWAESTLRHG